MLGAEVRDADPEAEYLGNYFVKSDIERVLEQYSTLVNESGRGGVDILLTGQWPLNISGAINDPQVEVEQ